MLVYHAQVCPPRSTESDRGERPARVRVSRSELVCLSDRTLDRFSTRGCAFAPQLFFQPDLRTGADLAPSFSLNPARLHTSVSTA